MTHLHSMLSFSLPKTSRISNPNQSKPKQTNPNQLKPNRISNLNQSKPNRISNSNQSKPIPKPDSCQGRGPGTVRLDWWLEELLPVLDHFVRAREGNPDVKFWQRIWQTGRRDNPRQCIQPVGASHTQSDSGQPSSVPASQVPASLLLCRPYLGHVSFLARSITSLQARAFSRASVPLK